MFLAHFTGSGLNEIMEMEIDTYAICLEKALELYKEDITRPIRVVIMGFAK